MLQNGIISCFSAYSGYFQNFFFLLIKLLVQSNYSFPILILSIVLKFKKKSMKGQKQQKCISFGSFLTYSGYFSLAVELGVEPNDSMLASTVLITQKNDISFLSQLQLLQKQQKQHIFAFLGRFLSHPGYLVLAKELGMLPNILFFYLVYEK